MQPYITVHNTVGCPNMAVVGQLRLTALYGAAAIFNVQNNLIYVSQFHPPHIGRPQYSNRLIRGSPLHLSSTLTPELLHRIVSIDRDMLHTTARTLTACSPRRPPPHPCPPRPPPARARAPPGAPPSVAPRCSRSRTCGTGPTASYVGTCG